MNRMALESLNAWKDKPHRNPLVLRGAEPAGNPWLVRKLAQTAGTNLFEINFELDEDLTECFKSKHPDQILSLLELRAMELLKFTDMAPDFCLSSRRINGSILKYVAIDATKKTGKKTILVVNFIVSMALKRSQRIIPDSTVLFPNEIQSAPSVFASLRYFYGLMPDLHVIAARSLVEFVLEKPNFFMPV